MLVDTRGTSVLLPLQGLGLLGLSPPPGWERADPLGALFAAVGGLANFGDVSYCQRAAAFEAVGTEKLASARCNVAGGVEGVERP